MLMAINGGLFWSYTVISPSAFAVFIISLKAHQRDLPVGMCIVDTEDQEDPLQIVCQLLCNTEPTQRLRSSGGGHCQSSPAVPPPPPILPSQPPQKKHNASSSETYHLLAPHQLLQALGRNLQEALTTEASVDWIGPLLHMASVVI